MRRMIGPVLVGVGVFLIVAAGLVRLYAYPALATVPDGYHSTTELEATGAQVFNSDKDVLATETHNLSIASETREDVSADAPEGVVVWVNLTTIERADGTEFQKSTERVPFDGSTGEAVDCEECDQFVEVRHIDDGELERVPTTFEGQVYKFPFGTERKDYEQWDGTLGESFPAEYEGEEQIQGVTVYEFVQVIEPTVVETRDVPGSVFGSDEATVQADMVYSMTRTLYVEPVTGVAVQRIEDRVQELVYDDVRVPAFIGTVQYTDAQVDDNVDQVKAKATLLGGTRVLFPVIFVLLGGVLLGLGLIVNRRLSSDVDDHQHQDRPLVTA